MSRRALSPVVGIVVLLAVTLVLAGAAGASLLDLAALDEPPEQVVLSARADAETNRITLVHEGGPTLDVRDLEIKIVIDGRPLFHQPPVPFAGARGFDGAPTGPFNTATDPEWSAGESAGVRLADTNRPELTSGATVTITVFEGDHRLSEIEATAHLLLCAPSLRSIARQKLDQKHRRSFAPTSSASLRSAEHSSPFTRFARSRFAGPLARALRALARGE